MRELRFDGRTVIITGAGGNPGLGRSHALLLAARGANVVVNDIGILPEALNYPGVASAEAVAEEIRAAGGTAIADTHSVATEDGAAALIDAALTAFGQVDALINNAGICRVVSFSEMTAQDFRQVIEVNLMGTVNTCRAVWPHLLRQGHGRIVNTASGSMAGFVWQTAYAAAKAGVFAFTRALAAEGAEHGIAANVLCPGALTRMVFAAQAETSPLIAHGREHQPPEIVSPTAAFLAHDSCQLNGECLESMGGQVRRTYLARTDGITDPAMTPETLSQRWEEVFAGTSPGIFRHTDADPRAWHIKPYRPVAG